MKLQLLPSTFNENGSPSRRQHLSCMVLDDVVALDAGSLAIAANERQRKQIRDVVLTHAHLDHIAGLPLFIDDLFATIKRPIQIHATQKVIDILERDIFNWSIYPRFSDLKNEFGAVMQYQPFETGKEFKIQHLSFYPIEVNHKVPAVGFIISDKKDTFAITGDTAELNGFWNRVNRIDKLSAVFIECAFPDELSELADISHHLTPRGLIREVAKLKHNCPIFVINIKPTYYKTVTEQLEKSGIKNLKIMKIGKVLEI